MELSDSNGHVRTFRNESVGLFEWHSVGLAVETHQGHSDYHFSVDGEVNTVSDANAFLPIWEHSATILGAFDQHNYGALTEFWKGFIHFIQWGLYDGSFDEVLVHPAQAFCSCDSNDCPLDENCLGVCNWNYWWNGVKCERCPYFCDNGCQENGSC
jgi:hypothetical protein